MIHPMRGRQNTSCERKITVGRQNPPTHPPTHTFSDHSPRNMQHHGDYNSGTTTPFYYPPNPTTDFHHHHHQQPPYASAPQFTPTNQPQPPPPPPYHPTGPILPSAPPSNRNPINFSTITINNISSYDDRLNFPPPPPQKWLLGKKHDLGMSSGDGGTWKEEVVFDLAAVPKVDVKEGGVPQFRVKWLAESGWQSTIDVLCQIELDGIRMRDPSTSRTLRIYPFDTITRCEVYDSSTFALWSKNTADIEPRRIRLQSDSCTTNELLDTVTAATILVKEMDGRSRPVDTVKVTEQSTEKKEGSGDEMNTIKSPNEEKHQLVNEMDGRSRPVDTVKVTEQSTEKKEGSGDEMYTIKPPNEEKHQWVLYEAATKCSGCEGDVSAFNRKNHCRQCGDMFCDNCTLGRIALTSEDNAPQVRGDIKCRCDNATRRNHNRIRYAQGQSRSAAKRRARKLGRCFKCGNFSHDGACPENRDNEFRKLCFQGPIRCYTESLLHPRGYAHARMISELDRLSENAKRSY